MRLLNLVLFCLIMFVIGCNKNPLVGSAGESIFNYGNPPGAFAIGAYSVGDSFIRLEWEDSSLAESYTIQLKRFDEPEFQTVATSARSPYVISGLQNGQSYYVKVIANNFAGTTSSLVIEATPDSSIGLPGLGYADASGKVGTAFSVLPASLDLSGSHVISCSVSPSLPTGLSLDNSNCEISGTPTGLAAARIYNVTLRTLGGTSSANLNLEVLPGLPVVNFGGPALGLVGQALSISPMTLLTNGASLTSCTTSPALPSGLSINSRTCVVSGTPTSVLTETTYTVTATSVGGTGSGTFSLTVSGFPPTLSYEGPLNAKVGTALSLSAVLYSGGHSVISCEVSPSLPAGLSLSSDCLISGTPAVVSSATNYSITLTTSGGAVSADLVVSVAADSPRISFSGALGTSGSFGTAMSVSPTTLLANGAAVTCSISPALSVGLSLNTSTCVISGSPNATLASTTYTVTATNSVGSTSATVNLSVAAAVPTISYTGALGTAGAYGVPMSVSPTSLSPNGATVSCSISPVLSVGLSLNTSSCVISGTPTEVSPSTIYTVTAANSTGSTSATVTLSVGASVPVISYSGSTGTNVTFGSMMSVSPSTLNDQGASITTCSVSPALPAWASINNSTCVISGTPNAILASTTYTVTATNSAGSSSGTVTLSVVAAVPTISYSGATGTNGTFGTPMSVSPTTLSANGGAVTCSISPALSVGLSLNTSSCVISGTPNATLVSTTYTVTATNSAGSASASLNLSVAAAVPAISYSGATGTSGVVGTAMSVSPTTLTTNGSDITCTISPALPSWASINSATCVISGVPTEILASTTYTVSAVNSAGTATATVTLQVIPPVPTMSYQGASGTAGTYGSFMSVAPTTLNDNGEAITSCTSSPALPAWASIDSTTCVISGTPTAVLSSTSYTVTVTNTSGSSTANVSLSVGLAAPVLSYSGATGTSGIVNAAMSVNPTTFSDGGGAVSCTISPALPGGLSISSSSCAISGTPTAILASTSFTVTATNSAGSVSSSLTLSITDSFNLAFLKYDSGKLIEKCMGPFIIGIKDSSGVLFKTSASNVTVNLSTDASGVDDYYTTSNCSGSPVSSTVISAGQSWSSNLYYKSSVPGNVTMTASDPQGAGIQASVTIKIGDGAPDTWLGYRSVAESGVPSVRSYHSAVWTGSEMAIFGGSGTTDGYPRFYNPVTNSWRSLGINSYMGAYNGAAAVFTGTEIISFGGKTSTNILLNSGRALNPVTSSIRSISNLGAPSARYYHSAIWTGTEMIIWGGYDDTQVLNSGGRYNPTTNTWGTATSTTSAPSARHSHSAIWTGTEMIIWGGWDTSRLNTGARYNPVTDSWGTATSTSGVPAARYHHSAIWTGTEMIIWGGDNGSSTNSGGRYNPTANSWGPATSISNAPSSRYGHSAVWTGTEMIVWGGYYFGNLNSGGRYNPTTNTWGTATSTASAGLIADTSSSSTCWTGSELIVWSGYKWGTGYVNTGARYNPVTDSWGTATSTTSAPAGREGHTAIWTGTEMIIWGGSGTGNVIFKSGGRYNPVTNSWVGTTSTTNAPSARRFHSAIWTGSKMIIWGGYDGTNKLSNGGSYSPSANSWTALSVTGVPSARYLQAAVWTGTEMIIWGGYDSSGSVNTGGRYNPTTNTWGAVTNTLGAPTSIRGPTAVWTGTEMIVWGYGGGGRYDPATDSWGNPPTTSGAPSVGGKAVWTGQEMITYFGNESIDSVMDFYYP